MVDLDIIVIVPRLARPVPDLHETHAALDEPPRDQDLSRLGSFTIQLANVLGLAGDVEGIGGVHLHAIGQLERLDARFNLGVLFAPGTVTLVELLQ